MNTDPDWKDLTRSLKVFTIWGLSGIVDSSYLILWVIIQWISNNLIIQFQLTGIDSWVLSAFQILFAISTLLPIIIFIGLDISIMFLQAKRRIKNELDKDRTRKA